MLQDLDRNIGTQHRIAGEKQNDNRDNNADRPANSLEKHDDQQSAEHDVYGKRHTHPQNLFGDRIGKSEDIQIETVPGHPHIKG